MDVLSDVIASMRMGVPRSARVEWPAPWGQRFPSAPGSAGFQVVLQGSCWAIPPEGEPIPVGTGDVLFFPHGHGYALTDSPTSPIAEPDCDPYAHAELFASASMEGTGPVTVTLCGGYQLDSSRAHPLLRGLPEMIHLPARLGHNTELRAAVELLGKEIDDPRPGADMVVSALLDMLLLYILRAWFDVSMEHCKVDSWAAALADPAIGAALDGIHRDPAHPWTVESLGRRAGLSRAAFSRRFTQFVGQPPLTYLTWWRLGTAARMLRDSDAALSEIAAAVGYGSEFAFANAFKREYGMAPGKYRRLGCPPTGRTAAGTAPAPGSRNPARRLTSQTRRARSRSSRPDRSP
ncbi:AraC family transcriptional regulator [Microtetraspora sp. NBRC 16547]|uniref:AraC family transcriptional regulator n=1 Tax=Microtetraspora sp. NBRC 16547 TaxID=3030993 RepID=UPI0024A4F647|nr:AraC family transcriptional regulator [Microtetraspora sp. NBRC 16547]GLX02264.1 AraC family transcriptional regulator [Microtetraspora sp. NBRC 16547]